MDTRIGLAAPLSRRGVVTFVGAGPGDPALRTERAARRLAEADVVAGDEVPVDELKRLVHEGKKVARLVMGDPLESPRVVATARALVAAGVEIEVVPGVGARATAAAFVGVLGPSVNVAADEVGAAISALAPDAHVTLVAGAATPSQRVVIAPAAEAPAIARNLGSTSVLVAFGIPEEALRWAERRPLFGKRVLVTRAREQAGGTASLLREAGAEPVVVPTIEIHPPADPAPLARALEALRAGAYRWVAFTSANGVERTWEALSLARADTRSFGSVQVAAIGPATARALESRGLRPDVIAKEFKGEGLAESMLAAIRGAGAAPRVLLARAAKARDVLPETLRQAGCDVDVVPAYETRAPDGALLQQLTAELAGRRLDVVLFTSSSTVENLCDRLGPRAPELLAGVRVASIGPITTATAEARGVRVDVTAREYSVPGLLDALVASYG
jgi:uroporphyrinogen III methyltransferase/synthase